MNFMIPGYGQVDMPLGTNLCIAFAYANLHLITSHCVKLGHLIMNETSYFTRNFKLRN